MKNIKKKIINNLNVICMAIFLICIILSCFNLFAGIHSSIITTIVFIILGAGWGMTYYDYKKNKK